MTEKHAGHADAVASILIVDDAPAHLGILTHALGSRGFRILTALDGFEAIERAQFARPDLILLDVRMPGIDGFETCRRLKADERTRDIAVIFMTSLHGTDDLVEGFSAGGVDYLTKPVRCAELMARVDTHLTMRSMHRELARRNRRLHDEIVVRKQAESALALARDELEKRVALRTEELARTNAYLRAQIEERRRAEAKLAASEARARTIVEASPVPLCITSVHDGQVLYMNEPMHALFGLRGSDALPGIAPFHDDPEQRNLLEDGLKRRGCVRNLEVRFRRADGPTFWAVVTARIATYNGGPAIYLGLNDVTARKQAEESLRASEASLANAQRIAHLGDWAWNAREGMTHWSSEVYRILGLEAGAAAPAYRTFLSTVHPEDRAAIRRMARELLGGAPSRGIDHRVVSPDGAVRIVRLDAEAVPADRGPQPGLIGTLQDITERKRIEQALLESREQLRELSAYMEAIREQERKRIALEIHDELGQLLTALRMDVMLLRKRLADDPAAQKKTDDMRELVEKTIWMVRNVANHLRPAALNFGIVSALEWLAEDVGRRSGIECTFCAHGDEPALDDTQATAVFRIAQAALTNTVRHAGASHAEMTLDSTAAELKLRIGDDGRGFDPANAKSGYGLLGMRERARLIGATLEIASADRSGTVVSICLKNGGEE